MYKNANINTIHKDNLHQIFTYSSHIYSQSITQPLLKYQEPFQQEKKYMKNQKKSNQNKCKNKYIIPVIKISEQVTSRKPNFGHRKGKSMDLDIVAQHCHFKQGLLVGQQIASNKRKVSINSKHIFQMQNRNVNSQMKHYPLQQKSEIRKNKKTKSKNQIQIRKNQYKNAIEIGHTAVSHPKKKMTKNIDRIIKHSSTYSTKSNKNQLKSAYLLCQRRCKSSLKQKHNSRILSNLIQIGKNLPLSSKLNSLYSNKTSIYNSYSDLAIIQKKLSYHLIPQDQSEKIDQIRKYQSLLLNRSLSLIRNQSSQRLIPKLLPEQLSIQSFKTAELINKYAKLKIENQQSQLEIMNPKSFEQIKAIYNESSLNEINFSDRSAQNSIIEKLQAHSLVAKQSENSQCQKLNQIIAIIEKKNCNIGENTDKQYIIQSIRDILNQKKVTKPNQQIKVLEQFQPTQFNAKTLLHQNSLTSSFRDSLSSEEEISVINLEILDRALRQRVEQLRKKMKRQLQKIQSQRQKKQGDYSSEMEITKKWINSQIKQVHQTRTLLWKGFTGAKNLLQGQLSDKNRDMLKCLSEKFLFNKSGNIQLDKGQKYMDQQLLQTPIKNQKINEITKKMQCKDVSGNSNYSYSPQIEHERHQGLQYLISSSSHQDFQSSSNQQLEQKEDQFLTLSGELKKIRSQQELEQKELKRQRLQCQSPDLDSQNSSYGAILIERENTFLFSSQKKRETCMFDLSLQEKEDICQFIFLDLCIDISQQLTRESKIIQSIYNFIVKIREHQKKKKGFKTNSLAIKQYLTNFITFLKTKPQILQQIHTTLDSSMGPTAIQILRYMHAFNQDLNQEADNYILTTQMFDSFEDVHMKTIKIERYYDDDQLQIKRRGFVKNAIHIHNKAIYDAFNQNLDRDRPFGLWGQPFAWKKAPKFSRIRTAKQKNQILVRRAQQTIEYGNLMCGFMLDKQDCSFRKSPQVTQEYIQQIRYDRLSQMMARQLQQGQQRMHFFDDQETQLLVDMAYNIFIKTILQVCSDIMYII